MRRLHVLVACLTFAVVAGAGGVAPIGHPATALAHKDHPVGNDPLGQIGFDQHLNAQVPADLSFLNESGQEVQLQTYLGTVPTFLVLGYFECANLCSLTRLGLIEAVRELSFTAGEEFQVVLLSIDPAETPEDAARAKTEALRQYDRERSTHLQTRNSGWHFLTGEHEAIDTLAESVGFRFAYDDQQEAYAHASGLVLLTPDGRVSRYFFGLDYEPRDLRLGIMDAAENQIGTVIDRVLLFCYRYNPTTGKYTVAILNAIRVAGVATVLLLGGTLWWMTHRESQDPTDRLKA